MLGIIGAVVALLLVLLLAIISGGIFCIITRRNKKLKHMKYYGPRSATVAMDTVQTAGEVDHVYEDVDSVEDIYDYPAYNTAAGISGSGLLPDPTSRGVPDGIIPVDENVSYGIITTVDSLIGSRPTGPAPLQEAGSGDVLSTDEGNSSTIIYDCPLIVDSSGL